MKKALLVIDYTYDFVADDGRLTCGKPGQQIEQALCSRILEAAKEGTPIFFCNDVHEENDSDHPESKLFPPHNIRGTAGRELYGKVKKAYEQLQQENPSSVFLLDKTRYSAFFRTPLMEMLRERQIDTVELTGVCTDICVLHTAVDAYNLGLNIRVPVNCVASFNPQGHEYALGHFKNTLGAEIF